jgi:DNA-binding transcriptional MerR regulator
MRKHVRDPVMGKFRIGQVSALTGIPPRTIREWDERGLVRPSVRPSGGRGRGGERLYSFLDVLALRAAGELRRLGVRGRALTHVAEYLRRSPEIDVPVLAHSTLIVRGGDVLLVRDREVTSTLRAPGQQVMGAVVLSMKPVMEELRRTLDAAA